MQTTTLPFAINQIDAKRREANTPLSRHFDYVFAKGLAALQSAVTQTKSRILNVRGPGRK